MVGVADDCTDHYTLQSELQQWMLSLVSSDFTALPLSKRPTQQQHHDDVTT